MDRAISRMELVMANSPGDYAPTRGEYVKTRRLIARQVLRDLMDVEQGNDLAEALGVSASESPPAPAKTKRRKLPRDANALIALLTERFSATAPTPCRQAWNRKLYFPPPGERHEQREEREEAAKDTCLDCPIYFECREHATFKRVGQRVGEPYGIWGGTTPEERESLRRARRRLAQKQKVEDAA